MRIAMLVTGAPRTVESCIPSIKSLINQKHHIDYILHIWGDELTEEKQLEIANAFNSVSYKFPHTLKWDDVVARIQHLDPQGYDIRTIYSKSWANYWANLMRLEYERLANIKYDCIIFLRTDVKYGIENFDPEPYMTDPKKVVMSTWQNFGFWSDQFMIAGDQAATHFANMILWMIGHFPLYKRGEHSPHGETNVQRWMTEFGNYSRIQVEIPHKIVRSAWANVPFDLIPMESQREFDKWI